MKFKVGDKVSTWISTREYFGIIKNISESMNRPYIVEFPRFYMACCEKDLTLAEYTKFEISYNGKNFAPNVTYDLTRPPQEIPVICNHPNKEKRDLFTSKYWYCPDCKQDLGDV